MVKRTLPKIHTRVPGRKSRSIAKRLREVESPNITFISNDFPIFWNKAKNCLVEDVDGNFFLDLSASFGVVTLGHCNPHVVRTIKKQSQQLIHGMGDVHPSEIKVHAEREIARRVPIDNAQVILGLNGADAVEAALKTSAIYTKKPRIIYFEGAYHGLSYGTLPINCREDFRTPFTEQLGHFTAHAPFPRSEEQIEASLNEVERLLHEGNVGAVIFEPIQGRAGIYVAPHEWMKALRDLCHRYGALLIADEIFCGWGRAGSWTVCQFADIYCLGKSLAGGLPLSACVASKGVMAAWGESTGEAIHTSTFIGHPLACAVALTVINELERLHLLKRAEEVGAFFKTELQALPAIREVRGQGLMLAIQLDTKERASLLVISALQHGLILLPAGDGSTIEFTPPLTIKTEQIEYAIKVLGDCLKT